MQLAISPRNKQPVVNFRVLLNRELAASIFLFVSLGFGLYGVIYLFPLFTQGILGFTPTETGLALLPGGLATAVSALMCGRLLNGPKALVDPRLLIAIGVSIFSVSLWMLSHLTTQTGQGNTEFALLIRGFGLGFLFVPINQVAYAALKPKEVQQASGLINLARQLGGSFGIAVLGTYVQNQTQFHRVDLLRNYYSGNPAFDQRQQGIIANLMAHGYSHAAAQAASYGSLNRTLMQQAITMSYNDSFLVIMVFFLCCAPAIMLLKKPSPKAAAASAGGGH